ncbi:hypothetical protein BJY52DRAFT_1306363, partial [Lactarius psammicola]
MVPIAATRPLSDLATHPTLRWDDMRVEHEWNAVPMTWESLGTPPSGITTDLSVALKPHDENALIDALYEVSNPVSKTNDLLGASYQHFLHAERPFLRTVSYALPAVLREHVQTVMLMTFLWLSTKSCGRNLGADLV